ncbi:hypothetical protein Tco_1264312 [Tanacetum coccineum]
MLAWWCSPKDFMIPVDVTVLPLIRGERGDVHCSGYIPTAIPATVPIVDPPFFHDNTPLIPTETPTIPPVVSTLPHTSPFLYTDSFNSDTFDRPSSQDPYEVTVAWWRSRVVARSSPPSPPTRQILPAPPARKRVRALPSGLLASRYPPDHSSSDHFSSDDSSSDSPSDSPSGYSSNISSGHSIPDSSFDTPAISFEGHLIRGVDPLTEESYEAYTEPDIDSDVQADIDSDVQADIDADTTTTEAAAAREADVRVEVSIRSDGEDEAEEEAESEDRGTIEIGVDGVIEGVQRDQGHKITMPTATRTGMTRVAIKEMIERRVEEALEAY